MAKHHICLTIDCDPDGLSGNVINRNANSWESLNYLAHLNEELSANFKCKIPITWFLRIDNQIKETFGSSLYLHEKLNIFWKNNTQYGNELAWHPHFYTKDHNKETIIMVDQHELSDSMDYLWEDICKEKLLFTSFRNGEGWLNSLILDKIEKFGFLVDSSALPGLFRTDGHPMNWENTPNHPYYINSTAIETPQKESTIIELPINTWLTNTTYDIRPRLRYMNPAIHHHLFKEAVLLWKKNVIKLNQNNFFWVFILHPEEIMNKGKRDLLYAHSRSVMYENLHFFNKIIHEMEDNFEYTTLATAGEKWKILT